MVKKKKQSVPTQFKTRWQQLRAILKQQGVQGMLISNANDIRYLTGFSGEDSWVLVGLRSVVILSDRRFEEELENECSFAKIIMRTKGLDSTLKGEVERLKIEKLAIQAEYLTVTGRKALAKAIGSKKIKDTSGLLTKMRLVKSDDEITLIKKAVKIQEKAFEQLLGDLKPGMTEAEAAARLEMYMKIGGAQEPSFGTIMAAGPNSSLPHAVPGQAKIKKNQVLLIDFGARYNGYCSDMTRVVCLGKMSKQMQEVYQIVLDAHLAGIDAIKAGALLSDVDAAARSVIEKAGYGPQFSHSLGHGIGLDIHEEPRLAKGYAGELAAGHVVTVEPGIYLPGVGGVRIEDDILVTEKGGKNLCSLPKSLESAMI